MDGKVSKVSREFSDTSLQASLVDAKVSDGSVIRKEGVRLFPEEGRCPRETWTDDEVSITPWVGISRVLWLECDAPSVPSVDSGSPRSPESYDDFLNALGANKGLETLGVARKYRETLVKMLNI